MVCYGSTNGVPNVLCCSSFPFIVTTCFCRYCNTSLRQIRRKKNKCLSFFLFCSFMTSLFVTREEYSCLRLFAVYSAMLFGFNLYSTIFKHSFLFISRVLSLFCNFFISVYLDRSGMSSLTVFLNLVHFLSLILSPTLLPLFAILLLTIIFIVILVAFLLFPSFFTRQSST